MGQLPRKLSISQAKLHTSSQRSLGLHLQPKTPLQAVLQSSYVRKNQPPSLKLSVASVGTPYHSTSAHHPVLSPAASGSFIGYDLETRERVYISDRARNKGLYLLGASGTGKSTSFLNLILQDAERGIGVCFIDPVGSAINDLVVRLPEEKLQDVILLDLLSSAYTFGINLYECEDSNDPDLLEAAEQRVMHVFTLLFADPATGSLGVRTEQYISNSAHTLIKNQHYTMAEIADLFDNEAFCRSLLQNVNNTQVRKFWNEYFTLSNHQRLDRREAIYTKINGFLRDEYAQQIVGQTQSTIGLSALRSIMDDPSGKILLIKLSSTRRSLSQLVGAMIISLLSEAAKTRPTEQDGTCRSRLFNIYADEFHYFATDDWEDLIEQARKHNVGTTFGHQRRSQLPDKSAVRRGTLDTANKMVFRISGESAEEVAREFDCSPRPGPPTLEPFKTPVAEPIHYIAKQNKGMHPLPVTRRFFELYGNRLVELAEEEEQAERDYKLAWERYRTNGSLNAIAPTLPPPTWDSRYLLEWLNQLFYTAMKAGKEAQPVPVEAMNDLIIQYFIRVFGKFSDAGEYQMAVSQHTNLISQQKDAVRDYHVRKWQLERRYAPFAAYTQRMLFIPVLEQQQAEHCFRSLYRRLLLLELSEIREKCVIVKRRGYYIRPACDTEHSYSNENYYLHVWTQDKPQQESVTLARLRDVLSNYPTLFESWEAAITFFCNGFSDAWFDTKDTLRQASSWVYQSLRVFCLTNDKNEDHVEILDAWVLRPGIECHWYTWEALNEEINRRIEHVQQPTEDRRVGELYLDLYRETDTPLKDEMQRVRERLIVAQKGVEQERTAIEAEVGKQMTELETEIDLLSHILRVEPGYRAYVADIKHLLFGVAQELAQAPIEADSGLTKEVPTEIPSSEVERRIANELTMLRDLTARCIFHEGGRPLERTIEIPIIPGSIDDEHLRTRLQMLEQQTFQAGYYKARSQVKQEIARRQEVIQQNQHSTPPPRRGSSNQSQSTPQASSPGGAAVPAQQSTPQQPVQQRSGPPPRRGS